MSLCHSIIIDPSDQKYSAASPDELALVEGAKDLGFEFRGRDRGDNQELITVVWDPITESEQRYILLSTLEFNSDRKRMSVLLKNE